MVEAAQAILVSSQTRYVSLPNCKEHMLALNAVLDLGKLDFMMPSTFRYTLEQIFQVAKSLQRIIVRPSPEPMGKLAVHSHKSPRQSVPYRS